MNFRSDIVCVGSFSFTVLKMLKNVRFAFFRRNTREKERKKSTFEVIIVSFYNWFYVFLKFSPFFLVVVTVCETTLNFFKVEHLLYNSYFTFEMLTVFFLFSLILSFVISSSISVNTEQSQKSTIIFFSALCWWCVNDSVVRRMQRRKMWKPKFVCRCDEGLL